jgi:hypothetical protein
MCFVASEAVAGLALSGCYLTTCPSATVTQLKYQTMYQKVEVTPEVGSEIDSSGKMELIEVHLETSAL